MGIQLQPHIVQSLCDFLSSVEHKIWIFLVILATLVSIMKLNKGVGCHIIYVKKGYHKVFQTSSVLYLNCSLVGLSPFVNKSSFSVKYDFLETNNYFKIGIFSGSDQSS